MAALHITATTAKKRVLSSKVLCYSCGSSIKHGRADLHVFCSKTETCKKAQNAFHYHRSKGKSRDESLQLALVIVTVEELLEKRAA